MAKVTYIDPVNTVSGKLARRHCTTYMVRQAATSNPAMLANPCYTTCITKRKTALTASEITYRTRFGQICTAARQRMQDASKMPTDIAAFKAQHQYTTLYQFVWHQVADSME